jgi:hypothetical protein
MKEQKGGAFFVAAVNGIDRSARSFDLLALKSLEKFRARLLLGLRLAQQARSEQSIFGSGSERRQSHGILQKIAPARIRHWYLQWMNP